MIRAVIDTNVLVSALRTYNPDSPTIRIYYAILRGEVIVLHSPEIIAEYEDVLHRDKFSFDCRRVDEIIDFIRTRGQNISPAIRIPRISPTLTTRFSTALHLPRRMTA